jgi:predicted DNA-binding transcriptional regulator YafY
MVRRAVSQNHCTIRPVESSATARIQINEGIMAKGQDALFRQWHMLRLLPRYPQKVSAQSICGAAVEGFDITERSVQRDLNDLSVLFPLFCDDREKPYGWSWQKDAASFDLPGLAIAEAMALAMAEVHLEHMLPGPILDQLRPYFRAAHTRLDAQHNRGSGRSWMDKVRSVTPSQPLLAPKIETGVHRVISEALLNDLQAAISYRRRSSKICLEYRIHPLAIVQRGQLLYLCCRIHDYEDIRILAVNRIMSAKLWMNRSAFLRASILIN